MKKWLCYLLVAWLPLSLCALTPIPAKKAFQLKAYRFDPNTVALRFTIASGYFLYKNKLQLTISTGSELGSLHYPKAIQKKDLEEKPYYVYKKNLLLDVPILNKKAGTESLSIQYQGCSEEGFCYPPVKKIYQLTIGDNLGINTIKAMKTIRTAVVTAPSDSEKITQLFSNKSTFLLILSFYSFGLLLAFTPCILPMIPVLSGIIVGVGKHISTQRAFMLSFSYVLGMSFTYAIAGIVIATIGKNLQAALQAPIIISLFSLLFVLLALSMFGLYELKLPERVQAKIANVSRRQKTGAYLGSALMGALSTLILSPCVTAPLVGALSYIAHTGDMVLGAITLFFLSLGMGTPLLLIGTSAGKLLPKAGPWMNGVKSFFGLLLLAVAVYLISRIIPPYITLFLWAGLLIITAVFIGALNKTVDSAWPKLRKGFGTLVLFYGALLLIGGSLGNDNPLMPLANLAPTLNTTTKNTVTPVKSIHDVKQQLAKAKGKTLILDFYADWCASCKVMEKTVLDDAAVKLALNGIIFMKANVTNNDKTDRKLGAYYNVIAPPSYLFFDKKGEEIRSLRITGEVDKSEFLKRVEKAKQ